MAGRWSYCAGRCTKVVKMGTFRGVVAIPTSETPDLRKRGVKPMLAGAWCSSSAPFPEFTKPRQTRRRIHAGSEIPICCGGDRNDGRRYLYRESGKQQGGSACPCP